MISTREIRLRHCGSCCACRVHVEHSIPSGKSEHQQRWNSSWRVACMHACMHAYIHTYIHTYTYGVVPKIRETQCTMAHRKPPYIFIYTGTQCVALESCPFYCSFKCGLNSVVSSPGQDFHPKHFRMLLSPSPCRIPYMSYSGSNRKDSQMLRRPLNKLDESHLTKAAPAVSHKWWVLHNLAETNPRPNGCTSHRSAKPLRLNPNGNLGPSRGGLESSEASR